MAIIKNIKMVVNAHMVTLQMFLTTRKVVADIRNVVIVSSKLTTTHPLVVRKIATDTSIWLLLLLMTEPITITNDHRFVVVIAL
jgi:hypothetical protein